MSNTEAKVTVKFAVRAEPGKAVFIAGDFNGWDPWANKMSYKESKGVYVAKLRLTPGSHQYRFIIDGTWCADPENVLAVANDFGSFNSLIDVSERS